jgi:hypothetical protein
MILKRCLYIFLSVWLINAIVCFHGNDFSAPVPDHLQYPGETCQEGDTVLDFVAQILSSDQSADHNNHQNKKYPRKILVRRLVSLDVYLPELQSFVKNNLAVDLHRSFGKNWFNKAFLPGYYNFLFRFKPF